MNRRCAHCDRPLTREDFVKDESKNMEAERRKRGLEGVKFVYYRCPGCGYTDIFVELHPLEGESDQHFHQRRAALESTVRQLHADQTEVVLVER